MQFLWNVVFVHRYAYSRDIGNALTALKTAHTNGRASAVGAVFAKYTEQALYIGQIGGNCKQIQINAHYVEHVFY